MTAFRLGYRPALDGLRGVAVSLVMVSHLAPATLSSAGDIGVLMFFTLSGFLITTLLIQERETSGRVDLPQFYKRRALRLLPALIVLLMVLLALDVVVGSQAGYRRPALFTLFYVANWAIIHGVDFNHINHTWSLSIEEHFYLLWPLTMVLVLRNHDKHALLWVAIAGAAASWAWRVVLWSSGASLPRVIYGTDTRLDGLLIGCLLAIVGYQRIRHISWPLILAALVGVGSPLLVRTDAFHFAVGYAAVGLGTAVVIAACLVGQRIASVLETQPLVWVGGISYGLYLWHLPVYGAVFKFGGAFPYPVQAVIAVALSLAIAALSYRLVEKRFLRLKRRASVRTVPVVAAGR
jgi:peptidoglycan/LPS O-acetylase OafA/YrhL